MELSNTWFKGTGSPNGIKTIIKVRQKLKKAFDADIYKNRIEINWPYEGNEYGLPHSNLLEEIYQTESSLYAIEKEEHSIHTVTLIGNNCATWIWYSKNETLFMDSLHTALLNSEKRPLEIYYEFDSEWEHYFDVLEKCGLKID